MGAAIARPCARGRTRVLLGGAAVASLPDLDLVPGLLAGDFARWHHGPSHSLAAGLVVAVALPALGYRLGRGPQATAALVALAYLSHLALDLLTYDAFPRDGIGIPLLWPASSEGMLAPVHLFFFGPAPEAHGLAEAVLSFANLWAVVWEAALFGLVGSLGLLLARRRERTWSAAAGALAAAVVLLVCLPHLGGTLLGDLREPAPERPHAEPRPDEAFSSHALEGGRAPRRAATAEGAGLGVPGRPDSADAEAPLSAEARRWIRENRELIGRTAARFDVPPLALAGVVAAERTLLFDPYDEIVDGLFRVYFATLTERELQGWVSLQEGAYQRELRGGQEPGLRLLRSPYLWSVGPAQVSFRNALFYEPRLARLDGRERRTLLETVDAILSDPGSLEYAAVILLDAQEAYARYADLDLRERPGILATLYHLGSPTRRALRLGEENRRRELRGQPQATPRANFYGRFVDRHVSDLEDLLR